MALTTTRSLAAFALSLLLAACGGGGGGASSSTVTSSAAPVITPPVATPPVVTPPPQYSLWSAPAGATPATGNYVYLQSDGGDYIGAGRSYSYSDANAAFTLSNSGLALNMNVKGAEQWSGAFLLPRGAGTLQAGTYLDVVRTAFADPVVGGVEWTGESRGCNTVKGWVVIDKVALNAGAIDSIDLRFEQQCDGKSAALHGQIHWTRAGANNPPPVTPPPSQSSPWSAPAGATPATGNYVYLQSDGGDYIGGGRSYSYSNANAILTLSTSDLAVNMTVQGNEQWNGKFLLPRAAGTLQTGYYPDLVRTAFADPVVGGVEWYGEGRGCNTIKGWVAIDKVTLNAGILEAIDFRFEQRCEGGSTALHGQVHWTRADVNNNQAPGPKAIPASLWQPAAGNLPSAGSYIYLESRPGDFVGAGKSYLYTRSNATLAMTTAAGKVSLRVAGDQNWTGDFQGMSSLAQLGVGFYDGLMRYPFHNPVTGGLSLYGDGRGCNQLSGWFAVDKITYTGTIVTALDMRFAQYCDGSASPLYGKVHWDANDASTVPGPQNPPPAGLWNPGASFVAPAGNYLYLVSDPGDFIGQGRTELITSSTATITPSGDALQFTISAAGWQGNFVGMNSLTQLTPGYYGDLQRYPFNNAVKGGLNWSGNGRGCNVLAGWFVVDQVSYAQGALSSIDLRFEQRCDGSFAAQHGQIHWAR